MSSLHISLAAEPLVSIGGFPFTNSMLASLIGSAVVLGLFFSLARRMQVQPVSGVTGAIEASVEFVLDLIEQVTQNRQRALAFFPLLGTFFTFILINNWLGLLPGVGSITVATHEGTVPLLRGATADLNTTLALAILSVVLSHVYAIRQLGLFRHARKYVSWNPILLFVGMLELVSDLSKIVSFSFRLFGNIFAGEVLLVVIAYLAPALGPLPFFMLELFVGLVQALVFTMLSLVFLEIATTDHGDHHESPDRAQLAPSLPGRRSAVPSLIH